MTTARELTKDELDDAVADGGSLLVDFWAEWCQPCKAMAPTLDEIAEERDGVLVVAKVDVEAYPDLVQRYGIAGIPHLILFQDGEVAARIIGAQPKARVLGAIDPLLDAPRASNG